MNVSFDTNNFTAQDAALLDAILDVLNVDELANLGNRPQVLDRIHPDDNPENGGPSAQDANQVFGLVGHTHTATDVAGAFGGGGQAVNPLGFPAPSTAGAAAQPIAPGLQFPGMPATQMPALGSSVPAGAPTGVTPPAAATASGPAPGGGEVDADGLPWNAEIHSSSKKKNADGRWGARRNVSADKLAQVTAQLRQAMAAGGVAQQHQQQVAALVQQQPMGLPVSNAAASAINPLLMGAAPAPVPQPVEPPPFSFEDLAGAVTDLQTKGLLTMPELFGVTEKLGLPSFHLVKDRPDLFVKVWEEVGKIVQPRQQPAA